MRVLDEASQWKQNLGKKLIFFPKFFPFLTETEENHLGVIRPWADAPSALLIGFSLASGREKILPLFVFAGNFFGCCNGVFIRWVELLITFSNCVITN